MNKEPVTIESITQYLQDAVENKIPIAPSMWVDACAKLNLLLGDEEDKLHELQQKLAQKRFDYLSTQTKKNVSEANLFIETTEEYKEARKLESKIKRIVEQIRISKVQGRMRADEMKGY